MEHTLRKKGWGYILSTGTPRRKAKNLLFKRNGDSEMSSGEKREGRRNLFAENLAVTKGSGHGLTEGDLDFVLGFVVEETGCDVRAAHAIAEEEGDGGQGAKKNSKVEESERLRSSEKEFQRGKETVVLTTAHAIAAGVRVREIEGNQKVRPPKQK